MRTAPTAIAIVVLDSLAVGVTGVLPCAAPEVLLPSRRTRTNRTRGATRGSTAAASVNGPVGRPPAAAADSPSSEGSTLRIPAPPQRFG
jgi:hypothetical protein